mmetsp:Transcript_13696/g.44016  ORF Transcript_13696/g.44016 Transcript_13696/m.44016 type:complete len:267 (+) Transcript_13696:1619-2419(+)
MVGRLSDAPISSPMPRARAVSRAMAPWSPVIILTTTPCCIARSIVRFVSGLGGSRKVSIPTISIPPPSGLLATASARMPRCASSSTFAAKTAPMEERLASSHSRRTTSGAPLTTSKTPPSGPRSVASVRRSFGSNGVKSSCSCLSRLAVSRHSARRTSVSSASLGGSFQRVARAARARMAASSAPFAYESTSCSTILLRVSVPVLSEQRTVIPASCSIDASRATIAFFAARRREPSAIVAVQTTCIAMGMEATSSTAPNETAGQTP